MFTHIVNFIYYATIIGVALLETVVLVMFFGIMWLPICAIVMVYLLIWCVCHLFGSMFRWMRRRRIG